MIIIKLTESITEYLFISSALLLILGMLSFLMVKSLKVRGRAKMFVYALIIILPLVYPLNTLFPESVKIPVRLESDYFQPHSEVYSHNGVSSSPSFSLNSGIAANEVNDDITSFAESETMTSDIKEKFSGTMSVLYENWRLIATIVWGGVFFFLLIRIASAGYKTNKFIRLLDPVTNSEILKLVHQCSSETGLRSPPQLLVVEDIPTPIVMGFFKPVIIIPRHLLKPEFREGLRFTMLHELKHLQQHHNWWLLVESLIGAAYFFHPVFYWAKRKIHEELEHICDRHVTNVTDKSVSYADFLLNQIWQQGSCRNPALSLPFISTASKTTARIHSILENAGATTFMHIRDRVSVLMVLTAFPLILLLSFAPSVHRPDKPLDTFSPSINNRQESINPENKIDKPELNKEISIMESSSTRLLDTAPPQTVKELPAVKTEEGSEPPSRLVQKEAVSEPVIDTKIPENEVAEGENKVETAHKSSPIDTQVLNPLSAVPESNMLLEQSISDKKESSDKPISTSTIAEKYLGAPVSELSISRISNIKILDEFTVLFMMRGGGMYLTRLSDPSPGLLYASAFNLVSNTGKISKYDRIQAITNGQIMGSTGMLGQIYPYKYEGNKYEAIKFLKKSLLKELVTEGVFNEFNTVNGQ